MSARTKLVLGLVGAAAAGVVVGLLLAPITEQLPAKKLPLPQAIGELI